MDDIVPLLCLLNATTPRVVPGGSGNPIANSTAKTESLGSGA